MSKKVLVLESGGSKFITGVIEEGDTKIKGKRKVKIDSKYKDAFLEDVTRSMKASMSDSGYSLEQIDSIGAISAGLWDYHRGVVIPPNLPFDKKEVALGKRIKKEFGKPVYVENDVNAAVRAEELFGYCGDNEVDFLGYLTISTGIGLGLLDMNKGKLLSGESGKVPEVGHNIIVPKGIECGCGGRGHWEAYGSGRGMCRLAKKMSQDPNFSISTKELLERASNGDDFALEVINKVAYYNAVGIGHIINHHEPGALIVGGTPVVKYPELVLEPVKELLKNPPRDTEFTYVPEDSLPTIKKTELGCDNVVYGAASIAINELEENRVK